MGVVGMSNPPPPPPSQTKDFFTSPSPALSLSLAGIFRDGAAAAAAGGGSMGVEEGDEGSNCGGGGGRPREETVEISSENSGPLRSRSDIEEYLEGEGEHEEEDYPMEEDDGDDNNNKKKKRKKYHRHTVEQIREMESLFKESPHPDEKQRQQLSKQLGLHPRQVKFWFQNRRTQIKAIQERHENALLKTELEKLRDDNKSLRETIHKGSCPNCGFAATTNTTNDPSSPTQKQQQQLRIENARLKSEVEKLRAALGRYTPGTSPNNSSGSAGKESENRSCLEFYSGIFGLEKTRIMEMVNQALEELKIMAFSGEPLWVRSLETGREILNYDEYTKQFAVVQDNAATQRTRRSIEASREFGVVFVDLPRLVQSFLDVNQWKEMFPSMISKAATVDVICIGEGSTNDGAVQLMFAELQMLTPMVATREVYFVRYPKKLNAEQWAIVDVSIDRVEDSIDASLTKCRKRASGCIIEDQLNGHCKVTWVEHLESQKSTVHSLFRAIVNSGLAFGANHWMATLQLHCERVVFFMATNVPTKDSSGVATLAGRKSILQLAHRMTVSFCRAIGASSYNTWTKVTSKCGDDIRVASRKNLNDPGEPLGVIICAVSSVWLPVSHHHLFDFLRDENRRIEWDIMSSGNPVQSIVNLAKGQNRGNAVTIQTMKSKDNSMWVLQDCCTNSYESMVVYAPVEINSMQSVMTGCNSSNVAILASGFSILSDGVESRPPVITSKPDEKSTEAGSLLTIAFQVLTSDSQTAKLSIESVESVNSIISCTLQKIKASLNCEDG